MRRELSGFKGGTKAGCSTRLVPWGWVKNRRRQHSRQFATDCGCDWGLDLEERVEREDLKPAYSLACFPVGFPKNACSIWELG